MRNIKPKLQSMQEKKKKKKEQVKVQNANNRISER